jgi:hypothetical protein
MYVGDQCQVDGTMPVWMWQQITSWQIALVSKFTCFIPTKKLAGDL